MVAVAEAPGMERFERLKPPDIEVPEADGPLRKHVSATSLPLAAFESSDVGLIKTVILKADGEHNELAGSPLSAVPAIFSPMPSTRHEELRIHPARRLGDHYEVVRELGRGGYGVVREARRKDDGRHYAVKSITHAHLEEKESHTSELIVAWRVKHPYLVSLLETFQDNEHLHFVMELCTGCSLEDRVVAARRHASEPRGLPRSQCMRYVWDMLAGIAYLHHYHIAHRDCKPNNFMLFTPCDHAPLKLIDFGIACHCRKGEKMRERLGTAGFAAPEVAAGLAYDLKCDIWSIGAVSYFCCVGFPPFAGADAVEIMRKVVERPVPFDPLRWDLVEQRLTKIVSLMLLKDPAVRPSANEIAQANMDWLLKFKAESVNVAGQQCCVVS